jgi:hypothetical protein
LQGREHAHQLVELAGTEALAAAEAAGGALRVVSIVFGSSLAM